MPAKAESKWDNLWDFLDGLAETAQVSENGYKEPVGDAGRVDYLCCIIKDSPSQTARYTPLRVVAVDIERRAAVLGTQVLQALIFLWQNYLSIWIYRLLRGSGSSTKGAVEGRI